MPLLADPEGAPESAAYMQQEREREREREKRERERDLKEGG